MRNLIFISILFAGFTALAQRPQDTNTLNECLWNQEVYGLKADCNDMFHHYLPAAGTYSPKNKVRLGSFNIYRSAETKYKQLDLVAKMMHKSWDIIALSELQPNRSRDLKFSVNAMKAMEEQPAKAKKAYVMPRYLQLLKELQKLDKSWGMIVSPIAQGSDAELFGYLYRGKQARPVESKYCKENYGDIESFKIHKLLSLKGLENLDSPLKRDYVQPKKAVACTLALDGLWEEKFTKIPLTARFESKNFDFSYITLHLKFRANDTEGGQCADKCQKTAKKMLNKMGVDSDLKDEILKNNISSGEAQYLARFFEATATVNAGQDIIKAQGDNDVIIAGDFNLDYETSGVRGELWKTAIQKMGEETKILIEEKTSISTKFGLANNYDHFILLNKEGFTDECDIESAKPLNFMSEDFFLASKISAFTKKANFSRISKKYRKKLEKQVRFNKDGELIKLDDESLDPIEVKLCNGEDGKQKMNLIDGFVNNFECQVFHPDPEKHSFRPYTTLMSDHVPISMTCSGKTGDE